MEKLIKKTNDVAPSGSYSFKDAIQCTEIIKDRLYFATFSNLKERANSSEIHFFSIDNDLVYKNFFSDFGPLNLGCLYKYCVLLSTKLKTPSLANKAIIHWTSLDPRKRANAAYLIASFSVIYLDYNPSDITRHLTVHRHPFLAFQDAILGPSLRRLRMIDCLCALQKAFYFKFVDFTDFNLKEYETLSYVMNGDITWILPGKFIAFQGPNSVPDRFTQNPEFYADYFVANKVETVIRLNQPTYDASRFEKYGIKHHDLYFTDGSPPTNDIAMEFLKICENSSGPVAVHCKAGLGRTGTLIATYLMKHFRFTALEAIAWLRICRSGSVIGPQQNWLEDRQQFFWKLGQSYRMRHYGNDCIPPLVTGIYSLNSNVDQVSPIQMTNEAKTKQGRSTAVQNRETCSKKMPKKHFRRTTCVQNTASCDDSDVLSDGLLSMVARKRIRCLQPLGDGVPEGMMQEKPGNKQGKLNLKNDLPAKPYGDKLLATESDNPLPLTQGDQLKMAKLELSNKRKLKK